MGAPIGIGNRGVSALGASLVRLILDACGSARISLLMGSRDSKTVDLNVGGTIVRLPVVNYRMSPRAPLQEQLWWIALLALLYRVTPSRWVRARIESSNRWIASVANADLVGNIWGGDSFSDIYGLFRFAQGCLPTLTVLWIKRDIVLLPQTYGPYDSRIAKWIARYILLRAKVILARDSAGLAVVRDLTKGRRRATACPDVAFALPASVPADPEIEPPLALRDRRVLVGLNVNGLMYNGGYTRNNMFGLKLDYRAFLDRLMRTLLGSPDIDILLVPHTFADPGRVESDNGACRMLAKSVSAGNNARVHVVVAEHDQYHIKGVIGLCDFFIGSRMHACIAALSQGIPTVGVAYSRKFEGVFESVGVKDWVVDGRTTSDDEAVFKVIELLSRRATVRDNLLVAVHDAQQRLKARFQTILADVERGRRRDATTNTDCDPT